MGLSHKGQGAVVERAELSLLPRKVSTGLTDIMMPVANEAELEKIAPDFPALTELSRRYNVVGCLLYTSVYQGAVVVCQGAGDSGVHLAVVQAVSVLTGLGSDKITVVQWK